MCLLHTPNIPVIFEYVLYLVAGEELKAKAARVKLFFMLEDLIPPKL